MMNGIKETSKDIKSFLMLGQSNMAGRGDFGEVEEINNPNCFMLRMGRWQKMSEPINPDRAIFGEKFHSGIGLAASFADQIAKIKNCKVGLIPCADGGTEIDEWMPQGVLYQHAISMAKLAMRTSTLSGILWHQGESDCFSADNLNAHKEKFLHIINSLRKDLGKEDLPIIIGELSNQCAPCWGLADRPIKMNEQYHDLVKVLSNSAIVSAIGLKLKDDGIHFNSKSLREFGKRYAAAYLEVIER